MNTESKPLTAADRLIASVAEEEKRRENARAERQLVRRCETEFAARPRPVRVSPALYKRAVDEMQRIADRRGLWAIALADDRDARAWRAWNQAAMRQIFAGALRTPRATAPKPQPQTPGSDASTQFQIPFC